MSSSNPKRPTFAHWMRSSGQLTDAEVDRLGAEWSRIKPAPTGHKVFTSAPTTWTQFLARKYPRQFITYQAYLRLIGAAPTLKKD